MKMVKFGGFFWKGPKDRAIRVEKKLAKKEEQESKESTISDALEEIEAEETYLPEIAGIEDELVQLDGPGRIATETTGENLPAELPEKIIEMDEKISHVDSELHSIRDESEQVQEQLDEIEKTMKKLISTYESPDRAEKRSQRAVGKEDEDEIPSYSRPTRRLKERVETVKVIDSDELPIFQPLGRAETPKISAQRRAAVLKLPEFVPGKILSQFEEEPQLGEIKVTVKPQAFGPEEVLREEPSPEQAVTSAIGKKPFLTHIKHDYLTLVLVMRWIEFLLERTVRDKLSLVLDYYRDIGWISDEVKTEILSYARGEMQDITKYMPQEEAKELMPGDISPDVSYKKVEDWRLSADDHLKSLLFIMKIADINVDRDKLNSLEQTIQKFKEDLRNFHGI